MLKDLILAFEIAIEDRYWGAVFSLTILWLVLIWAIGTLMVLVVTG